MKKRQHDFGKRALAVLVALSLCSGITCTTAFAVDSSPDGMTITVTPSDEAGGGAEGTAGTEGTASTEAGTEDSAGAGTEEAASADAGTESAASTETGTEDGASAEAGTEGAASTETGTEDTASTEAGTENAAGAEAGTEDAASIEAGGESAASAGGEAEKWQDPNVDSGKDLYTPDSEHVWVQLPDGATLWADTDVKAPGDDEYENACDEAYAEAWDKELNKPANQEKAKAELIEEEYQKGYQEALDERYDALYQDALKESIEAVKKDEEKWAELSAEFQDYQANYPDEEITVEEWYDQNGYFNGEVTLSTREFDEWFKSQNDGKSYEEVYPKNKFAERFDLDQWIENNEYGYDSFDDWYENGWFGNWFNNQWWEDGGLKDAWDTEWREENGYTKEYYISNSSLPVYEVKDTWVRVSADGEKPLWVDLANTSCVIQGEYTVTGRVEDQWSAPDENGNHPTYNVYNDTGNNVEDLPDNTKVKVIGWEYNKWGTGQMFYQVEYTDNQGNTQTGWMRTWTIALQKPAEKPHPAPHPAPPADLKDGEVFYAGETGDYSTIFAYLHKYYPDEYWNPTIDIPDDMTPVQLYKLTDKDGREFYAYCRDNDVPTVPGVTYTKATLAEALAAAAGDGGNAEEAELLGRLSAIVQNGYRQGDDGSVEKLKGQLGDAGKGLTPGLALTATQAAIWYWTNPGRIEPDKIMYPEDEGGGDFWRKLIGYCYGGGTDNLDAEETAALEAALKYLIDLEPVKAPPVSDPEPVKVEVSVKAIELAQDISDVTKEDLAKGLSLNTNVIFTLKTEGNLEQDNLRVDVFVGGDNKKSLSLSELEKTEDGSYIIKGVELQNGQKVDITVSGEIRDGGNIYVFEAKGDDGKHLSQPFIAFEDETVSVSGTGSKTFTVEIKEEKPPKEEEEEKPPKEEEEEKPPKEEEEEPPKEEEEKPPQEEEEKPPQEEEEKPPKEEKEYPDELPDPNDPDSPDEVTILEDGVPKTYIKVWDPEKEEFVYIPDDEVPLADVPETGDISAMWYAVTLLSACGLAVLHILKKREEA